MVPTISVIIPTYNRPNYLTTAIESVLRQTSPPLEIIIVDDGSSDGTEQIIKTMISAIPIRFMRQSNQGPSAARNLGVSRAQADWVAFLDDDDLWYPDKLSVVIKHIARNPRETFFYSRLDCIDRSGRYSSSAPLRHDELSQMLFGVHPAAYPSTVVVRKDVYMRVGGFDVSLRIGEDLEFYARMLEHGSVQCIDEALVQRRAHHNQSHSDPVFLEGNWPCLYAALNKLWHGDPHKCAAVRKKAARVYAGLAKQYIIIGDYERARECSRRALGYSAWFLKALRRWGLTYIPIVRDWYRFRRSRGGDST
jgi:glycosyltransferase involved in cell wall biosynthesis